MELNYSKDTTIHDIQTQFATAFPGLKLKFFTKHHDAYKGSPAKFMIQEPGKTLGEIAPGIKTGYLIVEPDMITWQLERLLEEECGLHTQVFRKSGETWLETSVSDDLTLEQQQAKVRASESVHQEFVDPVDYREMD